MSIGNPNFYQWGEHSPQNTAQNPYLPLTDEQKESFQRLIQTASGPEYVGQQIFVSGESFFDPSKDYKIGFNSVHQAWPGLQTDPTQERLNASSNYWSSGNLTIWPDPSGEDRYSAFWWDQSGIYFAPNPNEIDGYYSYPYTDDNAGNIFLFDDLDQDAFFNDGEIRFNPSRKYLLYVTGDRQVDQFGVFNYARKKQKLIENPIGRDRSGDIVYQQKLVDYYYSHFSNADHDKVNPGLDSFKIFSNYIHYIPHLTSFRQGTDGDPKDPDKYLNEIPFLSSVKAVYVYSVYGDNPLFYISYNSPKPPFPPVEREDEEEEQEEEDQPQLTDRMLAQVQYLQYNDRFDDQDSYQQRYSASGEFKGIER